MSGNFVTGVTILASCVCVHEKNSTPFFGVLHVASAERPSPSC